MGTPGRLPVKSEDHEHLQVGIEHGPEDGLLNTRGLLSLQCNLPRVGDTDTLLVVISYFSLRYAIPSRQPHSCQTHHIRPHMFKYYQAPLRRSVAILQHIPPSPPHGLSRSLRPRIAVRQRVFERRPRPPCFAYIFAQEKPPGFTIPTIKNIDGVAFLANAQQRRYCARCTHPERSLTVATTH
jgi:hypothetical protein